MNNGNTGNKYRAPAVWALWFSLSISLITLIIYIIESGFSDKSDEALLFLLAILRYSSLMVCICSLYLLAMGIYRLVRKPSVVYIVQITLLLFSVLYGAGLIIIDAFILSIAVGNG